MNARCKTVIVVDDDQDLLKALKFSFEVEGYAVWTYVSGEALLSEESLPECSCLIVDFRLSGIDGLALLDALRRRGLHVPAVLITTPQGVVSKRAAAAGVPVIEKPVLTDALFDKVRSLIAPSCATPAAH